MIAGLWLLRRRGTRVHGVGAFLIVGSPFGVVLAFVILVSYENYNTTRANAETEATKVVNLASLSRQFPSPAGRAVEASLECYARAVIDLEWPAMTRGGDSTVVDGWVALGTRTANGLDARTPNQRAALQELAPQNFARADARQARLDQARTSIPPPLALVLIVGALLVLADVLCMAEPREHPVRQAIMVASITAVIVSGLLLVSFFDNPFENEPGGLRPQAMERALAFIEHGNARGQPPLPRLCNSQGEPLPS